MIDLIPSNVSWLNASGAIWALAGGLFLSRGLLMADDAIKRRAGTYWDSSPPAIRGLCEQRIEAKFGLAQILIGFLLQLVASLGVTVSLGLGVLSVLSIAFVAHYYSRYFKYWVTVASLRFVEEATEKNWRLHFLDVPDNVWRDAARRVGVVFKPPKGE